MRAHVVDNASHDGTPEMVTEEFPEVVLHALPLNAGFSVANNVVLRDVQSRYALLLNPDTELLAGTLDHMVCTMEGRPDVGMAGCRLVRPDGTLDHAAKRSFPTPTSALGHFLWVGRRGDAPSRLAAYHVPELADDGVGEVDAVNGAFMLVRVEAMQQVGLLDEGYWLYMEDLDWCWLFRARGWKILYDGRVTAVHVKGGTAGRYRELRQNVAFHRGMARFYRRHLAGANIPLDMLVYFGIYVRLVLSATYSSLARRSGFTRKTN